MPKSSKDKTQRIPVLVLKPVGKSMSSVIPAFEEREDLVIEHLDFPTQVLPRVRHFEGGVLVLHTGEKKDVLAQIGFLKLLVPFIRSGRLKVLVTTTFEDPRLLVAYQKVGIPELLKEPIRPKTLNFKLTRTVQSVSQHFAQAKSQDQPEDEIKRFKRTDGAEAKEPREIKSTTSSKMKFLPSVDAKIDCWRLKGGGIRKKKKGWEIGLAGPAPSMGSWAKAPESTQEKTVWRWEADPGIAKKTPGTWYFEGEKPDFRGTYWSFLSPSPKLEYRRHDGEDSECKIQINLQGQVEVAKDSSKDESIFFSKQISRGSLDQDNESDDLEDPSWSESNLTEGQDDSDELSFNESQSDKPQDEDEEDKESVEASGKSNDELSENERSDIENEDDEAEAKQKGKSTRSEVRDESDEKSTSSVKSDSVESSKGSEKRKGEIQEDNSLSLEQTPARKDQTDVDAEDEGGEDEAVPNLDADSEAPKDSRAKDLGENAIESSKESKKDTGVNKIQKQDEELEVRKPKVFDARTDRSQNNMSDATGASLNFGTSEESGASTGQSSTQSEQNSDFSDERGFQPLTEKKLSPLAAKMLEQFGEDIKMSRQDPTARVNCSWEESPQILGSFTEPGPSMKPLTIGFLVSEMMALKKFELDSLSKRFCTYLSHACGGMAVEYWIQSGKGWKNICKVNSELDDMSKLLDQLSKEGVVYIEKNVAACGIFGKKKLLGVIILSGKKVKELDDRFLHQVSEMSLGMSKAIYKRENKSEINEKGQAA